ncbi:MAG: MarR family winged helix-turn-helix transcriptional regulator [Thiotrichaceae bacterium]
MRTSELYNYVERLNNLLRIDSRKKGATYGLQPIQLEALHYLSICNTYSNTPIAVTEYLGQTKGTVSQTLKVLEKKGYLTKHSDVSDKRISHLVLTKEGVKVLAESIPTPLFTNACKKLSEKEQTRISSALNTLLLNMLKTNEMKPFGVCSSCRYNSESEENQFFCNLLNEPLNDREVELICREYKDLE